MTLSGRPDWVILVATFLLVAFGLTMMVCASVDSWQGAGGDRASAHDRQCQRALVGLVGLLLAYSFKPEWMRCLAPAALTVSALLVALTLTSAGRGPDGQSTSRWLEFCEVTVQPSEILKLALIMHLARLLARKGERIATWQGMLPPVFLVLGLAGLVAAEPSMGVAASIALIGLGVVFLAGARWQQLALLLTPAVTAGLLRIWCVPYERQRLLDFIAGPSADPQGSGYQLYQSLIALGSGGWIGTGFGGSMQKFQFLPASHTDFVFSIIGEEGGFVVAVLVLGIYGLIVARALRLAMALEDPFRSLVAAGIALMISVQVVLNIAVVTGLMPTTGLPLPFLSYGGSSLVVHLIAVGVLLRMSVDRPQEDPA